MESDALAYGLVLDLRELGTTVTTKTGERLAVVDCSGHSEERR